MLSDLCPGMSTWFKVIGGKNNFSSGSRTAIVELRESLK